MKQNESDRVAVRAPLKPSVLFKELCWTGEHVFLSYLCVFGAQFVQDVGGVEAGVVTQLSGDDLQGLSVRSDQQLLFSGDGPRVIPQVFGQLHLYGTSTRYDGVVLEMKYSQLIAVGLHRRADKFK